MRRSYNKRVIPHHFQVGDLVLKKNQRHLVEREKLGKFEANWKGPFVITRVVGNDAYHLITMEGDPLPEPMNNIHLKIYYI